MRVLIVSPWLPHPGIAHAGGSYLFHMIRSLGDRGHVVHVICYGRDETAEQVAPLAELCASLDIVTPAYTMKAKAASMVKGGWRRFWRLGQQTHAEVRRLILERCRQGSLDIVHLMWTEMGRYLEAVPRGVGVVLGTLDVESQVRPREVRCISPGPARWRAARRARYLGDAERRFVPRADAVTVCSHADRDQLAAFRDAGDIYVVPPWLDAATLLALTSERVVPGRLTFMGAMDRVANTAAARFLLTQVWPLVKATHHGTSLYLVGAHPPQWLRQAAQRDPAVVVTGWAPDLTEVWAQTDVAVCPSLIGGGLLLKVAQPMCAGRPVVTTTLGSAGVAAPSGALAVADTPAAFAAAISALLTDRQRWTQMAQAGRRHISDTLDWEDGMGALEAAYASAVAGGVVRGSG